MWRLLLVLAALAPISGAQAEEASLGIPKPNILFILTDDERTDQMVAMPQTQELVANQGTTFTRAYAVDPLCCPSRASIFTGLYSHNHHVRTNHAPSGGWPAFKPLESRTFAVRLDEAGYETALIGKYLNAYHGDVPVGWDGWWGHIGRETRAGKRYTFNVNGELETQSRKKLSEASYIQQHSEEWVRSGLDGPWFLEVATPDPHRPYRHNPAYDSLYKDAPVPKGIEPKEWRKSLRSVRTADDLIGTLVKALDETGQLDNTYIVVASDNGLMMGQEGLENKSVPYEQATNVPLMVRGPGVPVGTNDSLVGLHDLALTFAQWGSTDMPNADGRPLFSEERQRILLEHHEKDNDWSAVRTKDSLYVEGNHHKASSFASEDLSSSLADLKVCAGDSCREAEGP